MDYSLLMDDGGGASGGGLSVDPSTWMTAYDQPRTGQTVPTNAVQSMEGVDPDAGSSWGGFFQDLLKTTVGYAVAKDAAQSGVGRPVYGTTGQRYVNGQPVPYGTQQPGYQPDPLRGLMPLLLVGLGVFAVVKLAK